MAWPPVLSWVPIVFAFGKAVRIVLCSKKTTAHIASFWVTTGGPSVDFTHDVLHVANSLQGVPCAKQPGNARAIYCDAISVAWQIAYDMVG